MVITILTVSWLFMYVNYNLSLVTHLNDSIIVCLYLHNYTIRDLAIYKLSEIQDEMSLRTINI